MVDSFFSAFDQSALDNRPQSLNPQPAATVPQCHQVVTMIRSWSFLFSTCCCVFQKNPTADWLNEPFIDAFFFLPSLLDRPLAMPQESSTFKARQDFIRHSSSYACRSSVLFRFSVPMMTCVGNVFESVPNGWTTSGKMRPWINWWIILAVGHNSLRWSETDSGQTEMVSMFIISSTLNTVQVKVRQCLTRSRSGTPATAPPARKKKQRELFFFVL